MANRDEDVYRVAKRCSKGALAEVLALVVHNLLLNTRTVMNLMKAHERALLAKQILSIKAQLEQFQGKRISKANEAKIVKLGARVRALMDKYEELS